MNMGPTAQRIDLPATEPTATPARQVAITERVSQLPRPSESASLVHVIERAARDPSVDIDKLRQLLDLRNQMEEREARKAFAGAMNAAQGAMRPVAADANNPQTKSRYASYHALDKALRPIYSGHGFSLSFNTKDGAPDQHVRVACLVEHDQGHSREYSIDMPADGKGAKGGDVMTKTHATGSAVSYGMRYLLKMIFNISVGDDDGNAAAGAAPKLAAEDAATLRSMLAAAGAPEAKFLKWAKAEKIEDIPAAYYDSCVEAIKGFKKADAK